MFKKILFCTDFSENAHYAFTFALNLAKTYQSKLLILHVQSDQVYQVYADKLMTYLPPEKWEELRAAQRRSLDRELNYYAQKMEGFKDYQVLTKEGTPFVEIIQMARKESVDLIIMGAHGRTGLDHVLFGSTAEKVVRKSPYPMLTIRLPGKRFKMP